MLKNYLKVAFRHLLSDKVHSFINIAGLSVGMAVALLIGLWIWDECTYNKSFDNYDRLGQVYQNVKFNKTKDTYGILPIPLAAVLRDEYPDLQAVSLVKGQQFVVASGEKLLMETGAYVEPVFPDMFSLRMVAGTRQGLQDPHSILLSQSLARSLFGDKDPLGRQLRIRDSLAVKVTGVYADLPANSDFNSYHFLAPWALYLSSDPSVYQDAHQWDANSYVIYAQLRPGASFAAVSAKIREIRMQQNNPPPYHPEFFVFPMRRWHLYGNFQNGVDTGGLIQFVWLFGIIGAFVLLLACINFMNLSTARSELRTREVGIRKAVGSLRIQLIVQFLTESVLTTFLAFLLAILLARLALPFFNGISGKDMTIPWDSRVFWPAGLAFCLLTGLIAGSYPALYLSSFKPVKVLKGTFRAGRLAALPRQVLVVLQFTVSVALIIGTLVVLRQVQYAKDRSVGYNRNGLIEMAMTAPDLLQHADALQTALLASGAIDDMAFSSCTITNQWGGTTDLSWPNKRADDHNVLYWNQITPEFGKTIGWQVVQGRDFSRVYGSDSSAVILNEAAANLMGLQHPLGQIFYCHDVPYQIIGITKDMIRESPFKPVSPAFYTLGKSVGFIQVRLSSRLRTNEALTRCAAVFKKFDPGTPFVYSFVDSDFAKKFLDEQRIGRLAGVFAALAIFISCLGLFGMASFVAEQRTREIGVRKVLGASVSSLWRLLSREFAVLVGISLLIAIPVAAYFMHHWLQQYPYHAALSWWIFATAASGALLLTLLTVSWQTIRAARANPVRSLRNE